MMGGLAGGTLITTFAKHSEFIYRSSATKLELDELARSHILFSCSPLNSVLKLAAATNFLLQLL
jgi:hypothetical protein